jgi:hypothetical protein
LFLWLVVTGQEFPTITQGTSVPGDYKPIVDHVNEADIVVMQEVGLGLFTKEVAIVSKTRRDKYLSIGQSLLL